MNTNVPTLGSSFGEGLLSLAARPQLYSVWYHRQNFHIDGYHFNRCRFDECILHLSSGNFEFTNCIISQDTTVVFQGNTIAIVRLFSRLLAWQTTSPFAPIFHEDGTISIHARSY
jgi:hypothetical protein